MTSRETAPGAPAAVPLSAYGHLLIIYVVWGASYMSVKVALSGPAPVSVLQLQSSRLWVAGLLLGLIMLVRHGTPARPSPRDIALCVGSGLVMWMGGNGLATLASRHATSSFIVMAMGVIPLWACLLDLIVERALPSPRVVAGLVLGVFGLFLVVSPTLLGGHAAIIEPGYEGFTVLVVIGAGISWSLGAIMQRPLLKRMRAEWAATFQMLSAALVLSPLAIWEGAPVTAVPSVSQWLAFGFLTLFASVIGMTSFMRVVSAFNPVVASTFAYVNPIIGVLLGWYILGEPLEPISLAGLAVVLASIAIVLGRSR